MPEAVAVQERGEGDGRGGPSLVGGDPAALGEDGYLESLRNGETAHARRRRRSPDDLSARGASDQEGVVRDGNGPEPVQPAGGTRVRTDPREGALREVDERGASPKGRGTDASDRRRPAGA